MKKLLGISLIAMMSVTAANAEIASKAYVDPADNGYYISTANSGGQNLTALDTQVKTNTDAIGAINNESSGILKSAQNYTDTEIGKLDVGSFGTATEVIMSVSESDGKIAATKGQITDSHVASNADIATSKLKLSDYSKGNSYAALGTTDSLNTALSKLENQIDQAKSTASDAYVTKAQGTENAQRVMTTTSTGAVADGTITASDGVAMSVGTDGNITISGTAATSSAFGVVKNGTNIDNNNGVISVKTGSSSDKGVLQVGTNIDVADGVISVKTADADNIGLVKAGNNITNTSGTLSVADASTSGTGVIKIATAAEAKSGDSALLAITPDTLHKFVGTVSGEGNSLSTSGHYVLTADVSNTGVATYYWELISREPTPEPAGEGD